MPERRASHRVAVHVLSFICCHFCDVALCPRLRSRDLYVAIVELGVAQPVAERIPRGDLLMSGSLAYKASKYLFRQKVAIVDVQPGVQLDFQWTHLSE